MPFGFPPESAFTFTGIPNIYPSRTNAANPASTSSAVVAQPVTSPIRNLPSSSAQKTGSWKRYINETYSFQISYPAGWLPATNITEPDIPYSALHVDNIVSGRTVGSKYPQFQTVPVAVAVYANPSHVTLSEWLDGVYGADLRSAPPGRMLQALAKAYAGDEGTVSFQQFHTDNTDAAEVGRIAGGVMFYSGFFVDQKSPYIYVVELLLTFDKTAKPSDSLYADLFTQMLSTFRLLTK